MIQQEDSSTVTQFVTIRVIGVVTGLLISLLISMAQMNAQTQAAINAEARADFAQADAELNKTYQAVLKKLPDAESKQKLKETQRAWIASRDAKVADAAKEANGGSMSPTLRYETMTELTQRRTKQLKDRLAGDAAPDEKGASTPKQSATPAANGTAEPNPQGSNAQGRASLSPDKQWEYKCVEYAAVECRPQIVRAGTTEVVVDLDQELTVNGSDSPDAEIVWAPDSKRFAFNYSPIHAHHTTFETVAFYQLRNDTWIALRSPVDEASQQAQLVQLAKDHLPKSANPPRHCAPDRDVLKLRNWTDPYTATLYAPCYGRTSGQLEAGFLFTLKFDDAGNWKIIKTHQLSKKELEEEQ